VRASRTGRLKIFVADHTTAARRTGTTSSRSLECDMDMLKVEWLQSLGQLASHTAVARPSSPIRASQPASANPDGDSQAGRGP
jgi:hypothetical protein